MSKVTSHEEAQSRLGDVLYLQISGRDPARKLPGVVAHIEQCADCRATLRALETAQRSLNANRAGHNQRYRVETIHQPGDSWLVILYVAPSALLPPDDDAPDDKKRSIRPIQSGGRLLLFTTIDVGGDTGQVMLVLTDHSGGYMITADIMVAGFAHTLVAHLYLDGAEYVSAVEEGQACFYLPSLTTEDDLRFELRLER